MHDRTPDNIRFSHTCNCAGKRSIGMRQDREVPLLTFANIKRESTFGCCRRLTLLSSITKSRLFTLGTDFCGRTCRAGAASIGYETVFVVIQGKKRLLHRLMP